MWRNLSDSSLWFAQALVCLLYLNVEIKAGGAHCSDVHSKYNPPLFEIKANSLYDAGFQHGREASERNKGWFNTDEIRELFIFAKGDGNSAYNALRRDSERKYPDYVKELEGIAAGAGVELESVWMAQLMIELENLMENTLQFLTNASGHCTDITSVHAGGFSNGFAHGHNEDWSEDA